MIGYLNGLLKWHQDNKIIVDVHGVGYLVEVVDSLMIPEPGGRIELYIYTYVREDTLTLYGFKEIAERELFTTLLGVSGIGPKAALNILSTLPCDQFINAILTENIPVLKQISGIGPKTAQRLILELKNKLDGLTVNLETKLKSQRDDELYEALQSLGYSIQEIDTAINSVDLKDKTGIEEKIKALLTYLGRGVR